MAESEQEGGVPPQYEWQLLPEYSKSNLPKHPRKGTALIAVPDEAGGYTLAFSDGSDWRRVQDRAIVS